MPSPVSVIEVDDAVRCPVHPNRLAVDHCPVCELPRCAADAAAAPGGGCLACEGARAKSGKRPLDLQALTGGAVTGLLGAVSAGVILSQYVDAGWFGYLTPFAAGIFVGAATEFGARKARGPRLRYLATAYAVVAAFVAFRVLPGGPTDITPWPPLVAAIGAWLWTAPPRIKPAS